MAKRSGNAVPVGPCGGSSLSGAGSVARSQPDQVVLPGGRRASLAGLLGALLLLSACGGEAPPDANVPKSDATRFLQQASFGPTESTIARVQSIGFDAYLNEQFGKSSSGYPGFAYYPHSAPADCQYDSTNPTGPASLCSRDNYTLFQVQRKFFTNALTEPDQLRQRVAFALSQIFVVSGTEIYEAYGMAAYQNMLARNAFGNFRTLLTDVTLSPVMGNYLDMVNNDKPNPNAGTEPNENYARELLQLFSIGMDKLNLDGTPQIGGDGRPLPSYDEDIVEAYAHLFTGWTYPPRPGASSQWRNPINYEGSMVVFANHHDSGAKQVLDGQLIPAGQTPDKDLADGLDIIFNHPNVGPFIGKQLIQHLVTSNPSPDYVRRVATVFNNNGKGVRGDLRAVVRAILLDPEARGDLPASALFGHLREPGLFITALIRSVGGQSDGVYLRSQSSTMGQNIFISPTVFNYYSPSYRIPGSADIGPEFGILDTTTALARANFIYQMAYGNGAAPDASVTGSTGTTLDLTPYQAVAADADALVELLNQRLLYGRLSPAAHATVVQAVNAVASTDTTNRARMAVYLVATSMQSQVER